MQITGTRRKHHHIRPQCLPQMTKLMKARFRQLFMSLGVANCVSKNGQKPIQRYMLSFKFFSSHWDVSQVPSNSPFFIVYATMVCCTNRHQYLIPGKKQKQKHTIGSPSPIPSQEPWTFTYRLPVSTDLPIWIFQINRMIHYVAFASGFFHWA